MSLNVILTGGSVGGIRILCPPEILKLVPPTLNTLNERARVDSVIVVNAAKNLSDLAEEWALSRGRFFYQPIKHRFANTSSDAGLMMELVQKYGGNIIICAGKTRNPRHPDAPLKLCLEAAKLGIPAYQLFMRRGCNARKAAPIWKQILVDDGAATLAQPLL